MKAIITPNKLKGSIRAIPSKSHAHRVLIARALAELSAGGAEADASADIPTFSEDIAATKRCLAALKGKVSSGGGALREAEAGEPVLMNCGESGSTLRFLLPVAMALVGKAVFTGSGKLPQRPISPLKEEMERHGCRFVMDEATDTSGEDGDKKSGRGVSSRICEVRGKLLPGEYELAGNISSQFITGLLFALPLLPAASSLQLTTRLESAGYVDMTLQVLRDFGIDVQTATSGSGLNRYAIPGGQRYRAPKSLRIEGDWSNAAFWLACGALGGDVTCGGLDVDSTQRDKEILTTLRRMGAAVRITDDGVRCVGVGLNGVTVNASQSPDLVPVTAALMVCADGESTIEGAQRLRIKESDRLATTSEMLGCLGASIEEREDGLEIDGNTTLSGGEVSSHNDHRIAMAAAVASCSCTDSVTIHHAEAVRKSYPNFFEDFASLGGKVRLEDEDTAMKTSAGTGGERRDGI